jgi:hypothetical protein
MLAGTKKEDQEAMLAAQKQAAANAESAAKSNVAPAPAAMANSWGSQTLGGGFGGNMPGASINPVPNWGTTPIPGAVPGVSSGWGGKAAPPPVTEWPER